jgi:hypothetical protein
MWDRVVTCSRSSWGKPKLATYPRPPVSLPYYSSHVTIPGPDREFFDPLASHGTEEESGTVLKKIRRRAWRAPLNKTDEHTADVALLENYGPRPRSSSVMTETVFRECGSRRTIWTYLQDSQGRSESCYPTALGKRSQFSWNNAHFYTNCCMSIK